jgi:putative membrane protein
MDLRYIIATIHILTFGLGVASIWMRASALRKLKDESGLNDVFFADNLWALAAFLWLLTGLWRAFGGLEKGSEYYLHNVAFLVKIGLFALVFVLEVRPMITLIKWRSLQRKKQTIDISRASSLARTSYIEMVLLVPIIAMATAMARGIFYQG